MNDDRKKRLAELRAKHRKQPDEEPEAVEWHEADGIYVIGPHAPTVELVCYFAAEYSEELHGHLEPTGEAN